jgi:hypothetical protein
MFSYEEALAILGDPRLSDRLERVTYNALPATLSNDMWSHQYDQQPNQISCTRAHRQWSTNNDDSNLFGLEPNFGCCTANLHQGWPKFVSNLWMATTDGGLFAAAYAPSQVKISLKGNPVTIDEATDYPFNGTVRFTMHVKNALSFPLVLRLPVWADKADINVNSHRVRTVTAACQANSDRFGQNGSSCDPSKLLIPIRREWQEGDVVSISFPTTPRVSHWYNDSAVFERGPLVFSLPLDGQWSQLKAYAEKSADWQIQPARAWNYAVKLGECDATAAEQPLSSTPFDVNHPPVTLKVEGKLLPQWSIAENSASPVPDSPVDSSHPLQSLTLVPYGAAKLRITAFPDLQRKSTCNSDAELHEDISQSAGHSSR